MKSGYRIGLLTAVCVSGLFYGGIAQGQADNEILRGDVARGKTLFARNCAGCHVPEGGGDGYRLLGPDPANLTSPSTGRKSDAELLKVIHDGKPNMPAWKGNLSEKQSRDVLAYVRTLSK